MDWISFAIGIALCLIVLGLYSVIWKARRSESCSKKEERDENRGFLFPEIENEMHNMCESVYKQLTNCTHSELVKKLETLKTYNDINCWYITSWLSESFIKIIETEIKRRKRILTQREKKNFTKMINQ